MMMIHRKSVRVFWAFVAWLVPVAAANSTTESVLLNQMKSQFMLVRQMAVEKVEKLSDPSNDIVGYLCQMAQAEPEVEVREAVIRSLASVRRIHPEVVATVARLIANEPGRLQIVVLQEVSKNGLLAASLVKELSNVAFDQNAPDYNRVLALTCLVEGSTKGAANLEPGLLRLFRSSPEAVATQAMKTAFRLFPESAEVSGNLAMILMDSSEQMEKRELALTILAGLSNQQATSAVRHLLTRTEPAEQRLREIAIVALERRGDAQTADILLGVLDENPTLDRSRSVEAIAKVRPTPTSFVPQLAAWSIETQGTAQLACIDALAEMAVTRDPEQATYTRRLADPEPIVRCWALAGLRRTCHSTSEFLDMARRHQKVQFTSVEQDMIEYQCERVRNQGFQ